MAETPAPVLFGAERVVIACESDASLTDVERREICSQLVKKAGAMTVLPVTAASAQDASIARGDVHKQAKQLLLRVSVHVAPVEQGRKSLTLHVMPVRLKGGPVLQKPLVSSASLVKVQGRWLVQGPIDAFTKLLAAAPRKLRAPLRSDS